MEVGDELGPLKASSQKKKLKTQIIYWSTVLMYLYFKYLFIIFTSSPL